ncbi:MAG TPA: RidA family protein [Humibacillus xanthopallidus]|nr:RidA family protein [Humibacillus xanthopallidus]
MRQNVGSGSPWESEVGYSRAVRVGGLVHVAGTTAMRDGVAQAPGDPYGQTRVALEIIAAALTECGASLSDVVRTRIYVTDIAHWAEVGRAHGEVFDDVCPAATMVQVVALISPDLLVEIEADAVITGPDATERDVTGPDVTRP